MEKTEDFSRQIIGNRDRRPRLFLFFEAGGVVVRRNRNSLGGRLLRLIGVSFL
jgi:hypothetical protein